MIRQAIVLGLMAVLTMPAVGGADIYRWKDANGVMHFSNQPPPAGATLIEKIEETPYDAAADRQRIEEERRLRLERQKIEVEERKADTAAREREAQLKLEQADRRLQEAQQLEQQAREQSKGDDCDDDYYLRSGYCGGYPAYSGRYYHGRPGSPDLYRGYYRENNNLYYKEPPRPGHPLVPTLPAKPGQKPTPRPDAPKNAAKPSKASPAMEDLAPKGGAMPAGPRR
jgi:hypothetical protein